MTAGLHMRRSVLRAALALAGIALAGAGLWGAGAATVEAWWFAVLLLAGLVLGCLGLLALGHLMSERWLSPVRAEAEAAALTAPFVALAALPLAFSLDVVFPWASPTPPPLPPLRALWLAEPLFLARSAAYLLLWTALGLWLARTADPRRASMVALALLAPASAMWAGDWALSRDPLWWSGLFGFGFTVSQLLASLAWTLLVTLLRFGDPPPEEMRSLERALLTLALLALWTWFVHFLIAWYANLPAEVAWYLKRGGDRLPLLWIALGALLLAVLLLAPSGFGRRAMLAGSILVLLHHAAHMLWLARLDVKSAGLAVIAGLLLVWTAVFATLLPGRAAAERRRAAAEA